VCGAFTCFPPRDAALTYTGAGSCLGTLCTTHNTIIPPPTASGAWANAKPRLGHAVVHRYCTKRVRLDEVGGQISRTFFFLPLYPLSFASASSWTNARILSVALASNLLLPRVDVPLAVTRWSLIGNRRTNQLYISVFPQPPFFFFFAGAIESLFLLLSVVPRFTISDAASGCWPVARCSRSRQWVTVLCSSLSHMSARYWNFSPAKGGTARGGYDWHCAAGPAWRIWCTYAPHRR